MNSKSKSLSNKPTKKQNTTNTSKINRRKSTSNIKSNSNTNIQKSSCSNTQSTQESSQKFSCFDKFIKYLISFNKLEEATRTKLKKENPKKNYSQNNYRINIPLPILEKICLKTYKILSDEPNLLRLSSPIYIFGDIHGQYYDLVHMLNKAGDPSKLNYLFSLEIFVLL